MTPAARVAAAIDVLDQVLAGTAAEKALTNWGRANRYAGSGDRAAVRDHVYSALRRKRSAAWVGNALTGRGLMIGLLRLEGSDPAAVFGAGTYAPPALDAGEQTPVPLASAPDPVRLDIPDWLYPVFRRQYGDQAEPILAALQLRAPVFLRANTLKDDPETAIAALARDGIEAGRHPLSDTALTVTRNARRVAQSAAYRDGLVELQDAASQAVVDFVAPAPGQRVLDFCAGGGGKSLAIAAKTRGPVVAHDGAPERMKHLPERAARAGAQVECRTGDALVAGEFDLVLCDVPCSGSGAWRRSPEGKWAISADRLAELNDVQLDILHQAKAFVAPDGTLAYVTCSLFSQENMDLVDRFLKADPHWKLDRALSLTPLDGGDGFFAALLTRAKVKS